MKPRSDYRLPENCYCCGAVLAGSWTKHKPDCEIQKLIEEMKNWSWDKFCEVYGDQR
jgi:DNA-directed RNA polymerase subunit N (RpoN/RPB10)